MKNETILALLKKVLLAIQMAAIPVYAVSGGILFYQALTVIIGLEGVFFGPIFFIATIIGASIPVRKYFHGISSNFRGVVLWLVIMVLVCLSLFLYDFSKNLSDNLLEATFSWDGEIELYLRENGTYKVRNWDWMTAYVSYGKYKVEDNHLIITEGSIKLGMENLKDTLRFDSSGLHFVLERDWKGLKKDVLIVSKNTIFEISSDK